MVSKEAGNSRTTNVCNILQRYAIAYIGVGVGVGVGVGAAWMYGCVDGRRVTL